MNRRAPARASLYEPYYLSMVLAAVGLGTLMLKQPPRQAILWALMALLGVVYRGGRSVQMSFTLAGVGRGALLGLVISLPLLAFLSGPLQKLNEGLYGTRDVVMLFYQVCFVSAPVEEFFFRGILQQSKGLNASTALYVLAVLLIYAPRTPFLVALVVVLSLSLLGVVYGYIADKHGLSAAIACRTVVGLLVQVFPSLFVLLRQLVG